MSRNRPKFPKKSVKPPKTEPNPLTAYQQLQFHLQQHSTAEQAKHQLQKFSSQQNQSLNKQRSISVQTRNKFYDYDMINAQNLNEGWVDDQEKWLSECLVREIEDNGGKTEVRDVRVGEAGKNTEMESIMRGSSKTVKCPVLRYMKHNRKGSRLNNLAVHTPRANTDAKIVQKKCLQEQESMVIEPLSKFKSTQPSKINIETTYKVQQKTTKKHYHRKSSKFQATQSHESFLKTNIRFKNNFVSNSVHSHPHQYPRQHPHPHPYPRQHPHSQHKQYSSHTNIKSKNQSSIAQMPSLSDNDEQKSFNDCRHNFTNLTKANCNQSKIGLSDSQLNIRSNIKDIKKVPFLGNKNTFVNNCHNFYRRNVNKIVIAQRTTGPFIKGKNHKFIEGNRKRCETQTLQLQDNESHKSLKGKNATAEYRNLTRMITMQKDALWDKTSELPIRIFQLTSQHKIPLYKT